MNTKAEIKGAFMKTDEIEVLFEQLLNNYANGNIEKQELIDSIMDIPYPDDENEDSMLNIMLYAHLVNEIIERDVSLEYVKVSLQSTKKLILTDKMISEMEKYKIFSRATKADIKDKITFYLDQNIFTRLLESDTSKELFSKKVQIVYSPAHIEEIFKSAEEYHKKELQKVSYFTDNIISLYLDDVPTWMHEEPKYSYLRIKRTKEATELAEEYKVIEQEDGNIFLPQYNNDKYRQIFNGQCPDKFLCKFKKEVNEALGCIGANYTIEELEAEEELRNYSDINGKIHTLYKAMDLLGFKKDKIKNGKDRKVRSSRHDIEHLLYASNANYFFTADENMYYRAVNILGILKKKTIIKKCCSVDDVINTANTL